MKHLLVEQHPCCTWSTAHTPHKAPAVHMQLCEYTLHDTCYMHMLVSMSLAAQHLLELEHCADACLGARRRVGEVLPLDCTAAGRIGSHRCESEGAIRQRRLLLRLRLGVLRGFKALHPLKSLSMRSQSARVGRIFCRSMSASSRAISSTTQSCLAVIVSMSVPAMRCRGPCMHACFGRGPRTQQILPHAPWRGEAQRGWGGGGAGRAA